ncbi:MAG: hypothetical protein J5824_08145, partial [Lachnospiraceae bacterium]|nr:hypothetical protein [Lachnospiraceae bacterium]
MYKRLLSILLAAVMIIGAFPLQAFATEIPAGESYFDFESSEYLTDEDEGTYEIKIYRHGSTDGEVNVAIKAADFLSTYGVDYEILIDGVPFTAVDGNVIDPSQFTYQEDGNPQAVDLTAQTADLPVNSGDPDYGAGSALRDAQAAYLNLPESDNTDNTESSAEELMSELYKFFAEARGAAGVLHFGNGDLYRTITVRLIDNDKSDGERMFLMNLMGTDAENTTVAANATTYVTISDDEVQEPAVFTLEASQTTLTKENPTAELIVRRTAGLQYFSTAYVSTVTDTADRDAYETFSLKPVAFTPGQETASVTVTGLDFSKGGSFGVRLEAEDNDEVETYYVSYTLGAKAAVRGMQKGTPPLRTISGTNFGSDVIYYGYNESNWDQLGGGFSSDVNGKDGPIAEVDGNNLLVYNENKHHYSMIYTNNPIDMVGVKNIHFSLAVYGKGSKKTTWVEMDSDQSFEGSTASYSVSGNFGWEEKDIPDVNTLWNWGGGDGRHYFKFATRCEANGNKNQPTAKLDWLRIEYALYSFDLQPCAENMPGYLFDFTEPRDSKPLNAAVRRLLGHDSEGKPIYSDSSTYYPPALSMKTTAGDDIAGFYNNWSGTAVLEPASTVPVGLHLRGAYFYKTNPYDSESGSYNSSAYYVPVSSDGKIYIDLNRDLIRTWMQQGTIDSPTGDATIQVYPVYDEDTAVVHFDYLGCEP